MNNREFCQENPQDVEAAIKVISKMIEGGGVSRNTQLSTFLQYLKQLSARKTAEEVQ